MTPKEKAMELMLKYYNLIPMNTVSFSKKCATIAIDEILEECRLERDWYWEEVKQEIEKL